MRKRGSVDDTSTETCINWRAHGYISNLVLIIALATFASTADAAPISMDMTSGRDGGFGFTVLHTARGGGSAWSMSGAVSSGLTGSLVCDYDGTAKITGLSGTLTGTVRSSGMRNAINAEWSGTDVSRSDVLSLVITDGGFVDFGPKTGGYLDYELHVAGELVHDGVFFFHATTFTPGPEPDANDMKIGNSPGRDYSFWGNNFKHQGADWSATFTALGLATNFGDNWTGTDQLRLGLDLGGNTSVPPNPEPTTVVLMGAGLAAFVLIRRRRRSL